jgi:hypothetical protein
MLNVALYLLTLAPLFLQTDAGTFAQSTSAADKNSTGSVELEWDDSKPLPNFPNNKYPFPSFELATNPHNGTRTGLQPAIVHSMPIKGVHDFSRDSPLAVGMNMLETTSKIPTKSSVVSGREQSDDEEGLDHFGIGPEYKCLLDCGDGRKFNADVKTGVMDARLSGGKVYGNKSETCLNLERNLARNHPDEVENEENRKVVKETKTILPIDEDACTFDLTSKNQKILNIGLDEKFLDREGDLKFPTVSVTVHELKTEASSNAFDFCWSIHARMAFLFGLVTVISVAVAVDAFLFIDTSCKSLKIYCDVYLQSKKKRTFKIQREIQEKYLSPEKSEIGKMKRNDNCKHQNVVARFSTFRLLVLCFVFGMNSVLCESLAPPTTLKNGEKNQDVVQFPEEDMGTTAIESKTFAGAVGAVGRRQLGEQKKYVERTSGTCPAGSLIGTKEDCDQAAGVVGWPIKYGQGVATESDSGYPPGCYVLQISGTNCEPNCKSDGLYFNTLTSSTVSCTPSYRKCACKLKCQAGTYHDQTGQTTCKSCVAGQYQDQTGKSSCKDDCDAGSYITADKTACSLCDKGKWQNQDDQSSCTECTLGKYNALTGQTSVSACTDDCGAGSYITADKTACSLCDKGKWQDQNGQPSCKICGTGTYAPSTGSTSCKDDCGAGSFITADKTACSVCDKGKWQDQDDQSSCTECTLGKYNDLTGQTSVSACKDDCGAGAYITTDKSACSLCDKGKWQDQDDQSSCIECTLGKYNGLTGQTSVSACKDDCPADSYITSDKSQCLKIDQCSNGKNEVYVTKHKNETYYNNPCLCGSGPCQVGMFCDIRRGHCSELLAECKKSAPILTNASLCKKFSLRCECTQCKSGYHTSKCVPCPPKNVAYVFLLLEFILSIIGLYLFISFLYYMFRPSTAGATAEANKLKGKVKQVAKLSASVGGAMVSVVVTQMQMITVVWSTIDWSPDLPRW